jgi:hypothetical protein
MVQIMNKLTVGNSNDFIDQAFICELRKHRGYHVDPPVYDNETIEFIRDPLKGRSTRGRNLLRIQSNQQFCKSL